MTNPIDLGGRDFAQYWSRADCDEDGCIPGPDPMERKTMTDPIEKARKAAKKTVDHHDQQCQAFGGGSCGCADCMPARYLLAALDCLEAQQGPRFRKENGEELGEFAGTGPYPVVGIPSDEVIAIWPDVRDLHAEAWETFDAAVDNNDQTRKE